MTIEKVAQRELESLLADFSRVARRADSLLVLLKASGKSEGNLAMILLDIISECYLTRTQLILLDGSTT